MPTDAALIFISYRRDDARWAAGMIYRSLQRAFRDCSVFFDRCTVQPGDEWPGTIRAAVERAEVVVVVIGQGWLNASDHQGAARLHQPEDWVRLELATALARPDQPLIIPVYIDDATPPPASALPPDLHEFPLRQGRSVREEPDFDGDLEPVVRQIAAQLRRNPQPFAEDLERIVRDDSRAHDAGLRQRLLEKVADAWIGGVLEKSVPSGAEFARELKFAPTAVVRPRGQPQAPLADSRDIAEVFEDYDQQILILGAPGSGKTTLLLQLARFLLREARRDLHAPIPVILNLSSWAGQRAELRIWLAEELHAFYLMPKGGCVEWVEKQQLILLLDGLDELAAELRAACVAAINSHLHEFPAHPIAVCCRLQDYETIGARLDLKAAVQLEAIAAASAEELLRGSDYAGLRAVLPGDAVLQEALTSPFLLNLALVSYRHKSAAQLALPPGEEEDPARARRDDLLECYIEARLSENDADPVPRRPRFYRRQTRQWLSWLAASMQSRSEVMFYIEGLQGSWLPTPAGRMAFVIVSSVSFGAVVGGIGGCGVAWLIDIAGINQSTTPSLVIVMLLGPWGAFVFLQGALARFAAGPLRVGWPPGRFQAARPVLACGAITFGAFFVTGLPFFLLSAFLHRIPTDPFAANPLASCLRMAAVFAIYFPIALLGFRGLHKLLARWKWWQPWMPAPVPAIVFSLGCLGWLIYDRFPRFELTQVCALSFVCAVFIATNLLGVWTTPEIRMVERLNWRWSWRGARIAAGAGALFLVIFLSGVNGVASVEGARTFGLIALTTIFLSTTLGGVWGGLRKMDHLGRRHRPSEGLSRTLRYWLLVTALYSAIGALCFGAFIPIAVYFGHDQQIALAWHHFSDNAALGTATGFLVGLFAGGSDELIKHGVLRLQLALARCLPLRLGKFLDHACACLLLRRVGARYIFIHRYLLDYFATRHNRPRK